MWFSRVFVQIRLFIFVIEPSFGFPTSFRLQFLLIRDLILINQREGQRQVLLRVGVEVGLIVDNLVAKLLLLELVDVV